MVPKIVGRGGFGVVHGVDLIGDKRLHLLVLLYIRLSAG